MLLMDPRGFEFQEWARLLTEQLAVYNVPAPVEDAWVDWAWQLYASPQLVYQGLVDPRGYTDWREWASQLVQNLQGVV